MSEVQGRPGSTMTTERRYGIAISVALILGGAYWALTNLTEEARTSQSSYPVQGTSLTVVTRSADVEIRSGDVRDVTVDRTVQRNVFGSDPREEYSGGKLEIRDTNCGFLAYNCDTEYVVTVPKGVAVTVDSTSGDLSLTDLPAGVTVKSTSGKVEARAVGGQVTVEATSGSLELLDLTASTVSAKTTSGDVDLSFTTAPTTVRAEASSGDVTVQLPAGTEPYKVDLDTSSGDESATVRIDPEATRTVTATTSSGDVTVEYTD